jgi:small subunit ribosomal protein S16
VAVKIKLKRMGKIRNPQYRIIVADARTKRDGRAIEQIGKYHPKEEPSLIDVDSERAQYWLGVGAQPTEPVRALLKITGDWQKFKGLPGVEGTLKVKEAGADKRARFDAALAQAHGDAKPEATTAKKRAKKAAEKPAVKPAETDAAEESAAESAPSADDQPDESGTEG